MRVLGKRADGSTTELRETGWETVANNDTWYGQWVKPGGLPGATESWSFAIFGGEGDVFHVDYNSQYWHLPD